jgi:hypothetical protein
VWIVASEEEAVRRIGFTGTSSGTTYAQRDVLRQLLDGIPRPLEAHHGDCIKADEDFHACFGPGDRIVVHPPINSIMRAYCVGDLILPEDEYIARNHAIVDCADEIFATPKERDEVTRSGTWATVRYAKKMRKPVTLIYPDGDVDVWVPPQPRQAVLL